MSVFNQKIINQINEKKDFDYTELSSESQGKLWKAIRSNDKKSINELISKIGQEKYNELEKAVKDDYSEYYQLEFFRNEEVPKPIRNSMLHAIFNKVIIENSPPEVKTITSEYIDNKELYKIASILHSIVNFCIRYNRTGSYIITVLKNSYDIDEDITLGLDILYNRNKISLKMDFIINRLTQDEEE